MLTARNMQIGVHRHWLTLGFGCLTWGLVNLAMAQEAEVRQPASAQGAPAPIDEVASPSSGTTAGPAQAAGQAALYAKFERLLTGAKLRGLFTVDGKPLDKLTEETYEISKVEKQPEGDMWVVTARIKYGERDLVFPVPLEVKWAGTTPVMTLDNMTIPGFGTFGARVVFHKDKYAGTWQHDAVGGHLFGIVELAETADSSAGAGEAASPPASATPPRKSNVQSAGAPESDR